MTSNPPKIENAPGLTWRPRKWGWEARWRARGDLVRKGYTPKSCRLWIATEQEPEPTAFDLEWIVSRANAMQSEMLVWSRGGLPSVAIFDGTLRALIDCYQADPDSPYVKLRFATRDNYDGLCKRLKDSYGAAIVADVKARQLLRWHEGWSAGGKVAMAHSLIGMLRTLGTFGTTILDDPGCRSLKALLHDMRFEMIKPRSAALSAEQVEAIRAKAHERNVPSIALAQAFQFDCAFRQKDCIGEWVPLSEKGPPTDVTFGNSKWWRGIRWEEVDENLILRHVTSKRNKLIELPLREAPMVMAELRIVAEIGPDVALTRDLLPASGPVIVHDRFGTPWVNTQFRRRWRGLADECGIPKSVKNMDSRAGAISEATDSGADLEHVRQLATHGDIAMTQKYSRNQFSKVKGVLQQRAAWRNKGGTK